jgi:hypothetical protein
MNIEKTLARLFGLEGDRWLRHANPRSVYSRFPVLAMIVVSVWSRVWIGVYFVVPLGLTLLWTFFNPRLFDEPDSLENWASKGVLGERIWKEREEYDIASQRRVQIHTLNAIQGLAMVPFFVGLYRLNFWMTMTGLAVAFLSKVWFFDRMVWLFEDMRELDEVRAWLERDGET